jgi:hypothetical protein
MLPIDQQGSSMRTDQSAGTMTARRRWARIRRISRPTIITAAIIFGVCFVAQILTSRIDGVGSMVLVTSRFTLTVLVLASVANWTSRVAAWWLLGPARWQTFSPRARRARMIARLVRVVGVYQRGRRGTKCHIEHPFGYRQEAWFWRTTPRRGDVYLVRCANGWGPHRSLLDMLYVGSKETGHGIIYRLPPATWRAAARRARAR